MLGGYVLVIDNGNFVQVHGHESHAKIVKIDDSWHLILETPHGTWSVMKQPERNDELVYEFTKLVTVSNLDYSTYVFINAGETNDALFDTTSQLNRIGSGEETEEITYFNKMFYNKTLLIVLADKPVAKEESDQTLPNPASEEKTSGEATQVEKEKEILNPEP